jgi:hypothetical protein
MEELLTKSVPDPSYGLLKNGVCIAPEHVRSSLEVGNEQKLLICVQGMSVRLFVRGAPTTLAPYLVYRSPDIAGEITVREYEGVIAGYRFGVYCYDADVDVDLIEPDGTVWWGKCSSYEPE